MSSEIIPYEAYEEQLETFVRNEFDDFSAAALFDDFVGFFVKKLFPSGMSPRTYFTYATIKDGAVTHEPIDSAVAFQQLVLGAQNNEERKRWGEMGGMYCIVSPLEQRSEMNDFLQKYASHYFSIATDASDTLSERDLYYFAGEEAARIHDGLEHVLRDITAEGQAFLDEKYLIDTEPKQYLLDIEKIIGKLSIVYRMSSDEAQRHDCAFQILRLATRIDMTPEDIVEYHLVDDDHLYMLKFL